MAAFDARAFVAEHDLRGIEVRRGKWSTEFVAHTKDDRHAIISAPASEADSWIAWSFAELARSLSERRLEAPRRGESEGGE